MDQTPADNAARCLTCGYLLQGLPDPICPECGRAFDPSDESTFDTRPPGWRRRRRIKRGAVALAVAVLLFAFAPRGILNGELTFTYSICGAQTTIYRRELKASGWLPFRYPSWHWTRHTPASDAAKQPACDQHAYDGKVAFDLYKGSHGERVTATWTETRGKDRIGNPPIATVETAEDVLRRLMAPGDVSIWP